MVVVILMGVVAALAFPRFNDLFEVDLKSSMRRLAGTIKFCFNEAIIKQATIQLKFNIDQGSYNHALLVTNPDSSVGEFIEMASPVSAPQVLPKGIFFKDILTPRSAEKREEGDTYILFYPTGYAEKAVIHIQDQHGRTFTLLVRPLTGSVKIFDGYIDFAEFQNVETPFGNTQSPF